MRKIRAGRNELIATLIASASIDADDLEKLVTDYRHLKIGDVVPGSQTADKNVVVQMRKPGRPAS